jgi:hypothetical protein
LRYSSTYALKPCPFCGCKSIIASGEVNYGTGIYGYRVECTDYHCLGSVFSSSLNREEARTRAVENWQKRT